MHRHHDLDKLDLAGAGELRIIQEICQLLLGVSSIGL